ncbi:MAG: hypothetical protein WAN14_01310 [Candidatus Acidiferrales bacterium]
MGCDVETAGSTDDASDVLCFLARAGAMGCGLLYLAATVGAGGAGCAGAETVSTSTLDACATVGVLVTAGAGAGVLTGWLA